MLVDYQLPGMDGLEFMRAARQVRPRLRTLIVSSLTDPLALTRKNQEPLNSMTIPCIPS